MAWDKLPFYAAHLVDELLIVDLQKRTVEWLALEHGGYQPVEHSRLIDLGPIGLAEASRNLGAPTTIGRWPTTTVPC